MADYVYPYYEIRPEDVGQKGVAVGAYERLVEQLREPRDAARFVIYGGEAVSWKLIINKP
jgi:hypothetical protein